MSTLLPYHIVVVVDHDNQKIDAVYTPIHLGPIECLVVERRHDTLSITHRWDDDPDVMPDEIDSLVTQYIADRLGDDATARGGDHG